MINHVVLVGRITRDPELRRTANGTAICVFDLAIDRKSGDKDSPTDFIPCRAWKSFAETMEKYVKKGNLLAVEGNIQNRSFEDSKGNKRTVNEVVVTSLTLTEFNKRKEEASTSSYTPPSTSFDDYEYDDTDNTFNITDEDLPF